jgi:hypothetical protein
MLFFTHFHFPYETHGLYLWYAIFMWLGCYNKGEKDMELMSPKNDFVFKRIFGSEENQDILLNFLNAAMRLPEHKQLSEIVIVNPTLDKRYLDDKMSVLDIRARTADGIQINIEIQVINEANMEK